MDPSQTGRSAALTIGMDEFAQVAPSTAESRLRNELLRDALDQWQTEDGAITQSELDEGARLLGLRRSERGRATDLSLGAGPQAAPTALD